MTAKEVLYKMPHAFDPKAADGVEAVVQYDISEPVYHVIKDGTMEVFEGRAEQPNVTVKIADDDLIKLMRGELNGMSAFMTGRLKVKGDMMLAQRLVGFVDRDKLNEVA
jgi:putative sterol carrier protein